MIIQRNLPLRKQTRWEIYFPLHHLRIMLDHAKEAEWVVVMRKKKRRVRRK